MSTPTTKSMRRLKNALKPFVALKRINDPLSLPDDLALRDFAPGVWPVMGELRELVASAEAIYGEGYWR